MPESTSTPQLASIILCGGQSTRMGFHKFQLPFGDRTILECVVANLLNATPGPIIAVASQETISVVNRISASLPIEVAVDQQDNSGPLEGIRVGLELASSRSDWAFVTSCDVPLIRRKVIQLLQEKVEQSKEDLEAVIPVSDSRVYGMTAVYRCDTHAKLQSMIANGQLRVSELATALITRRIDIEEIRRVDPNLESMKNLNTKRQYLDFLREHGVECQPEIEKQLN